MKKEIRLYNVVFPIWFLVLAWPAFAPSLPLLLLLLPANFLVDSLVLLLAARHFQIPEIGKLWKKSVWKIWLFGFLCDFAGGGLIMLLCFLIEGGISKNALLFPFATLYALPGVALSGVLLYWINRALSFLGTDLSKEQIHRLSLAIAIFTAPYLMLIPVIGW